MISAGAICTAPHYTGAALWVAVRAAAPDGSWHCRTKRVDEHGRADTSSRIFGREDLVVVKSAPVFNAGDTVKFAGAEHIVAQDLGDTVTVIATAAPPALRSGGAMYHDGGKRTVSVKGGVRACRIWGRLNDHPLSRRHRHGRPVHVGCPRPVTSPRVLPLGRQEPRDAHRARHRPSADRTRSGLPGRAGRQVSRAPDDRSRGAAAARSR